MLSMLKVTNRRLCMLKRLVFACLVLFLGNAWALSPIQVNSTFRSEVPSLHAFPITSDQYSSIVSYLKYDTFNVNKLTKYDGANSPYLVETDKISITPVGENWGQCVAFIRGVSNALTTSSWRAGSALNISSPKYSVVATFGANGSYSGHVGILIAVTDGGIYLLDQNYNNVYHEGAISLHFIPWNAQSSTYPPASGVNYRIVLQ